MSPIDWLLVVGINGAIILYGLRVAKGTRTTTDWFLAARSLPWWVVGLSLFATAVDSSDYVAIVGGAGWLESSRRTVSPAPTEPAPGRWYFHPLLWSCVFMAVVAYVNLVLLWQVRVIFRIFPVFCGTIGADELPQ